MKFLTNSILPIAAVLLITPGALSATTAEDEKAIDEILLNIASESAVYIKESDRNLPEPPVVQAYQAPNTVTGFGDEVTRHGVSFPLDFD